MALTQSDLSNLLAALKAGEMTDTIRRSLEWTDLRPEFGGVNAKALVNGGAAEGVSPTSP